MLASIGMAMMSGDSQTESAAGAAYAAQSSAADGEVDTSASSMAFENEMMEGEEESSSNSGGSMPMPQIEQHRLEREYIWGPGDGIAGIDELFVMFDRDRAPWLVLQDASGDVAALCSTSQQNNAVIAQVAAQWTWDAYGNVFSADHIAPHPFMRVGHKGLFVERLDVGVADASVPGSQVGDTPRLVPFAQLVYHNRNRTYNPQLGRFLQADPNASGMFVDDRLLMHGTGRAGREAMIDLSSRLGDGANLYQYVRSNPFMYSDPLGLFVGGAVETYGTVAFAAGALAHGLTSMYADNQSHDADWALDWSTPDDFHTRSDASWIQDIYDDVGIDDFVDDMMPFDGEDQAFGVATARGGGGNVRRWARVARILNKQGKVAHHIISWYKDSLRWFNGLKTQYPGIKTGLHDIKNMAGLAKAAHKGRHTNAYHRRVRDFIEKRMDPTKLRNARETDDQAFRNALAELRKLITNNPGYWFAP